MLLEFPNKNLERAEFWVGFILEKCDYPNKELLRSQFNGARFRDFCNCGCNSFGVMVRDEARPLAEPTKQGTGLAFEADFKLLGREETIEILLFTGTKGNLEYVEVDYCANSFPVPSKFDVAMPAFHTYASPKLVL